MNEPLTFAARLLAQRGALVEAREASIEAILPAPLAAELALPEHAVLGDAESHDIPRVGYGSAILERLVGAAIRRIPFAAARTDVSNPRIAQARAAAEGLAFRNGVFTVGDASPGVGLRLAVHALFTLHGDERREGLCAGAAALPGGAIVPGFVDAARTRLLASTPPAVERDCLETAAHAALAACGQDAAALSAPFAEGVVRRLARDRERIHAYFADLIAELDRRAARSRARASDLADKRAVLERERAAKIDELATRYSTRLEVTPVALLVVETPVVRVSLELRRRKASRTIELEYDGARRALVPPACDACGLPATRPGACDEAVHLLCEMCAPRSEGRLSCGACRGRDRSGRPAASTAAKLAG